MKEHMNVLAMQVRQKTEVEIQAEQESDRSWIRALNTKLYDSKIQKLINDSSNGSHLLKNEIRNSDNRLKAVKSGLPLSRVVSQPNAGYYVPDVEPYFRGIDKVLRKKELGEDLT